ncbi:MAG TPA: VOC family protein [Verrucomicrobiota bacterium]|nr:VOC family protein [Verrucomicrobiota bacterium]
MKTTSILLKTRALAAVLAFGWITVAPVPANAAPLPPLTAADGNPRLPGKFVWADLVTDDVPAAAKFYSKLFGWTFNDYGGYLIARNDDRPIGGVFYRQRPKDKVAEPRWFGYISVPNVEKAKKAVTANGGRVLAEPKKMPDRGEQAVFADAEGAVFGVVKSSKGDPEDFAADPGDWIWIQLFSNDSRKAVDFYRAVGGYTMIRNTETNRLNDYVLISEGYARAVVGTIKPESRNKVQPTWLPFVRVKSVTESVAQAQQLGGKVRLAPKPELFNGKVAVVADPTGASIGLLEWDDEIIKGGR